MTIYTIVYDGYERFLTKWLLNIKEQTEKPDEVIIVQGKRSFIDINHLQSIYPFKLIKLESNVMGELRNEAIKNITTEYMLYFSADDRLLPNAVETLKKYKSDVIALRFRDIQRTGEIIVKNSAIFKGNTKQWKQLYAVPGYHCVRRIINNKIMYYENIEIPNFPYLFMLESENATMEQTKEILAEYHRRENSHGHKALKNNTFKDYAKYIEGRAEHYAKERCKRSNENTKR